MTRLFISVLVLMLVLFSCKGEKNKTKLRQEQQAMNVLFIAVDDLRPELGFYGAKHIKSPNLDKLASEGLVFDRSYCNIPVCGASRASLLSGIRPSRNRFINYKARADEDVPEATSLPMLFKENGYRTISNGKVFHHNEDSRSAWDQIWFPEGNIRNYKLDKNLATNNKAKFLKGGASAFELADVNDDAYFDGEIARKGVEDLQKLKDCETPFFLAMGFMKPHLPFNAPKKYWDLYDRDKIELPKAYLQPHSTPRKAFPNYGELRNYGNIPKKGDLPEALAKELIHGYYACVSYVDAQIGLVLDELDKAGLAENTIVILWGDHGWNLGDHRLWCKHVNFETALRAPLVIKVPGKTKGEHTNAITEFIDIYPTLCELTGIETPETVQGVSFVPVINGKESVKNWAVSKFKDGVTLIRDDLFYTEWTDDNGVAYERMLFDHKKDPLELDNLADKQEYQALVEELAKELRIRWGDDFLANKNELH